jgi:hypothetical protein
MKVKMKVKRRRATRPPPCMFPKVTLGGIGDGMEVI